MRFRDVGVQLEYDGDFKIYREDDINTAIENYIKYFNTQRLAYTLKYKTPIQYRTELGFI